MTTRRPYVHPWAEEHVGIADGPLAIVRYCRVPGCGFKHVRRKGGGGRGAGFRLGNKQRGILIQHVKTAHPELKP